MTFANVACARSPAATEYSHAFSYAAASKKCSESNESSAPALLERAGDAAVDVAAALERQTLVRGRADQVVTERVGHVARVRDELAQPFPARGIAGVRDLVLENRADEVELELRPDHRRVAEEHAVLRIERVDAGREQALDRLGQRLEPVAGARGDDELADEERVAAGTLGQRGQRLARQRDLVRQRERELGGDVGSERRELDALDRPFEVHARLGGRARRHADEPRPGRRLLRELQEQRTRRVVEPVRVLDDDERRHHQDPLEERLDGLEQLVAAAAGSSASDSGVASTSASNGIASSGSHGARSGITPVTNGASAPRPARAMRRA